MKNQKGFTLLVSIVVTSMILVASFAVVNVAVKQLILANSNENSQFAFYNADSGVECAVYWDFLGGATSFTYPSVTRNITCGSGGSVSAVGNGTATTTFTVIMPTGCANVSVGKHSIAGGVLTIVDSRGYNTCTAGAFRRLERAEKLSYSTI